MHCAQVQYCLKWDSEMVVQCRSLRKQSLPHKSMPASPAVPTTPVTSTTSKSTPKVSHALISCLQLAKDDAAAAHRATSKRGPLPKNSKKLIQSKKGVCCLQALGKCITKKPKFARHKCLQCGGGGGSFFHEKCFWSVHCVTCTV